MGGELKNTSSICKVSRVSNSKYDNEFGVF